MRADRLLSILLLLQAHRQMTACELAERLEVSQRTIYRDMDSLSAAGVPVIAERGLGGGWHLLDGYQTRLTGLTTTEIQTLFLSRPAHLLADLGLVHASETALDKLLAALPSIYRRDAEYVRQRIHVDTRGAQRMEENVSFLPILQEAVWQERRLYLRYHLSTGPVVECTLDPLGLVASGPVWYLVAVLEGEINVYRVSRVLDARLLDQPGTRPKGFDLAAFWEASSARLRSNRPRYLATVRVSPEALPQMQQGPRCVPIEELEATDQEGWTTARLLFETEGDACFYLLGWGAWVEILAPEALRRRVIEHAAGVLELYTGDGKQAMTTSG